ncbi:MAG: hypothetical protein M3Z46_04375, partial [Actinomycetota bacterium]|nr:hypothetical protein [Actinomycetota bacterium]
EASGTTGPTSLVLVGHSSVTLRPLPPVLSSSTAMGPARSADGLAISPDGWLMLRLGQLGRDTQGGQLIEISPTGDTFVTLPLLRWRDAAIVGVTDQGFGVFRTGTLLQFLGASGYAVTMLDLRHIGVRGDLSNLADVALAPDGRIAVLVGDATRHSGFRVLLRLPGGAADRTVSIRRDDIVRDDNELRSEGGGRRTTPRPTLAFDGRDIIVAGDAGLMRLHDGRVQSRVSRPPTGTSGGSSRDPATLVAIPGGRWMIGVHHLVVLDRSGQMHGPGFGPCPADSSIRPQCPAVIGSQRLPHPSDVLPGGGGAAIGTLLLGLTWAGRKGRREYARLRLAVTIGAAAWVTAWFLASLAWGELHGSAPLLLLGGVALAVLGPAFPAPESQVIDIDPIASRPSRPYQPRVPDAGGGEESRSARRLEVVALPSRP